MKRKNNLICLDEYTGQSLLVSHNELTVFNIEGNRYYFKPTKEANLYKEKICCFICQALKVSYVPYDMAVYHHQLGHLSLEYKKAGEKEVSLYDILADYYLSWAINLEEYQDLQSFDELYNVQDVLAAFQYRYRNLPNKQQIIKQLQQELLDAFLVQIFLGNPDLHYKNLGVLESSNSVRLTPNYDFERSFYVSIDSDFFPYALKWQRSKVKQQPKKTILDFLETGDKEYFFAMMAKLPKIDEFSLNGAYEGQYRFFLQQYQSYMTTLLSLKEKNQHLS